MHLKKLHIFVPALMISTIFSTLSHASQQSVLAYHGVHVDREEAALLHLRPDVAAKLAKEGMPTEAKNNLQEFITVHDANPSTTPIPEIGEQLKAVRTLRERGIKTPTPQDALKFNSKEGVVKAYKEVVQLSGQVISPMEYLVAHEASLPGADPLDVVQHHVGVKALATLGNDHPSPQETKASKYFAKLKLLDQIPDLLPSAIYLQNNTVGRLADAIEEPSLPQMRATKFLIDAGLLNPNDGEINTIAFLVGIDEDLSPNEVREALRLANLRVNFIPNRDQIKEGMRQMGFAIGARSIEEIDEGLRQKKLEVVNPDPDLIAEGLRLATHGWVDTDKYDLISAIRLQNPGAIAIIHNPDKPQVKAMKYLMIELGLGKPNADEINAVVRLRDAGGLIKIKKPEGKHILGLLRINRIGGRPLAKALVMAAAHLVDPDGLNENPVDFKRIDYVVRLQSTDVGINEPTLPEVDAAQYLMDPGWGFGHVLIPLPTRGEIRATVYWRKSLAEGGLGDLNPTGENIRVVAHLQKPFQESGLDMAEPKMPQITAARHLLLTLNLNPFTSEDLAAVMDLQAGHGDVVANPRPDLEYVKAAKCLLDHGKVGIYNLRELEATKYLQMNPGNALGGAAIETPDWNQIQGTVYLQKRKREGGLHINNPTLAQVKAVVHSQTVLGLQEAGYLTPTEPLLNALVHLQNPQVNIQKSSIAQVRATVLLQTPGPGWVGMAGPILDPNPSAQRINATVELQDWQRPAAHIGVVTVRPTLAQIDAVTKGEGHESRMKVIAWGIQEGFGGRPVGTIPTILGHFVEEKDGFDYFRLVTLEDKAPPAIMGLAPLPASLERVRDRLLDRADGEHKLTGTTKFKVANANIVGLNPLDGGKHSLKNFVLGMGLTEDPLNLGAVIITAAGNRSD